MARTTDEARRGWPRRRLTRVLAVLCVVVLVWVGAALSGSFSSAGRPGASSAEDVPVSAKPGSRPAPKPDEVWVLVSKSKRRLVVLRGDEEIRSFPIVLGSDPVRDKQREGDGRTPVGTFYVCEKNAKSKFYLFIGISYPNQEDAARGLKDRLITHAEHHAILEAIARRRKPPWYTRLGGELGFHGGGTAWDWTRGCASLDNGDMRELFALVREGTTVVIEP